MKQLRFIIQKEYLQIFRDKGMMKMIFIAPILQLLILVNAADFSIKNIRLEVVDQDHSTFSRELISKFDASPYFILQGVSNDFNAGEAFLRNDDADVVLQIPSDMERHLSTHGMAKVLLQVNGIDGQSAGLISKYSAEILTDFNEDVNYTMEAVELSPLVAASVRYWYNPTMKYSNFMLPGLLVLLVTMIGLFMASMNIVKEKEVGTIEQLNVTPLQKWQFIFGKLFPFWTIGLFELAFGLLLGKLIYDIPINGSLIMLFVFAGIYLIVVLSMGLYISTFADTQQQSMFLAWFFMVIFILMSGLFTAIENMPVWAQNITLFNPVAWFIKVVRAVLLKGSSWQHIALPLGVISAYAVLMLTAASRNYKKRS